MTDRTARIRQGQLPPSSPILFLSPSLLRPLPLSSPPTAPPPPPPPRLPLLPTAKMNVDKLKKMAGAVRTGGKGSVRRKKKAVHKTTTTDDKRLQSTLKRVGVNTIPGIEEVNIFKDDVVIQFLNPKVQASIGANTWVVSGTPQTKKLQDLLPSIINQLGPDNLDNLRRLAEQFQKQAPGASGEEAGASAGAAQGDDDDVPELVPGETFEEAAEEKKES
uniref:Nascent polypeptide-associated complex subunit beta n=1 Tax=Oryza nivara TaxID=4536 RepID=A0A0E0IU52_ORYNI